MFGSWDLTAQVDCPVVSACSGSRCYFERRRRSAESMPTAEMHYLHAIVLRWTKKSAGDYEVTTRFWKKTFLTSKPLRPGSRYCATCARSGQATARWPRPPPGARPRSRPASSCLSRRGGRPPAAGARPSTPRRRRRPPGSSCSRAVAGPGAPGRAAPGAARSRSAGRQRAD